MNLSRFRTGIEQTRRFIFRYRSLLLILLTLFAAAGSTRFLAGDLTERGISGLRITQGGATSEDELRSCGTENTLFEDLETLDEMRKAYLEAMEKIFSEREEIFANSATWECGEDAERKTKIPELQALTKKLPGWHVAPDPARPSYSVERPVDFGSFAAVAAELQREYECGILTLQDRALTSVSRNKDRAGDFCCSNVGCTPVDSGYACIGPSTSDSTCDRECPVFVTQADIALRPPLLMETLQLERQRSRIALDRALMADRSFSMQYPIARSITCYQRASLDLRNELNLLADAASCLPKIWDAVTSLHDRNTLPQ